MRWGGLAMVVNLSRREVVADEGEYDERREMGI